MAFFQLSKHVQTRIMSDPDYFRKSELTSLFLHNLTCKINQWTITSRYNTAMTKVNIDHNSKLQRNLPSNLTHTGKCFAAFETFQIDHGTIMNAFILTSDSIMSLHQINTDLMQHSWLFGTALFLHWLMLIIQSVDLLSLHFLKLTEAQWCINYAIIG